jgi:hypothetical protein
MQGQKTFNMIRFRDAIWMDGEDRTVTVIGAGGIGSWLTLFLSRQGVNIHLWDMDTFSDENLSNQLTVDAAKNMNKALATKALVESMGGSGNITCYGKWDKTKPLNPIVFMPVDTMQVRKQVFDVWSDMEDKLILFDARMAVEKYWVYTVFPDLTSISLFDHYHIYPDSDVVIPECTNKATSHCGAMAASELIVNFNNWIGCNHGSMRAVATYIEYDLPSQHRVVNYGD